MSGFMRMFVALLAAFALGGFGAGTASAANSGTVGTFKGDCEVTFDRSAWTTVPSGWSSSITSMEALSGGTCPVMDFQGSGTLTKTSNGTVSFPMNMSFEFEWEFGNPPYIVSLCGYAGTFTGAWVPDTNPPHNHKKFTLTSTVNRTMGGFLCPATMPATVSALVDY